MSDWIRTASLGWMVGAVFGGTYVAAAAIHGLVTPLPLLGFILALFVAFLAAQAWSDACLCSST